MRPSENRYILRHQRPWSAPTETATRRTGPVIPPQPPCHTPVTIPRLSTSPDNPVPPMSSTTHPLGAIAAPSRRRRATPRPSAPRLARRRPARAIGRVPARLHLLAGAAGADRPPSPSAAFGGAAHSGIGNYARLFADPHFATRRHQQRHLRRRHDRPQPDRWRWPSRSACASPPASPPSCAR